MELLTTVDGGWFWRITSVTRDLKSSQVVTGKRNSSVELLDLGVDTCDEIIGGACDDIIVEQWVTTSLGERVTTSL